MINTVSMHKRKAPRTLGFAIIICSSSRHAKLKRTGHFDDPTGNIIVKILESEGHKVDLRTIVPDDTEIIRQTVREALNSSDTDVVVTSGGTGVSPKDVTIEAVKPLFDKEIPGFGELFRYASYQEMDSAAMLTRAISGIVGNKVVFCLPGSPDGAKLAFERLILREAGHIVKHLKEN